MDADADKLLAGISRIEGLLALPDEPDNMANAARLALEIAHAAQDEDLAQEARELAGAIRALAARRKDGSLRLGRVQDQLWRLRGAIEAPKA